MATFEAYIGAITETDRAHDMSTELELLFLRGVFYGCRGHYLESKMSHDESKAQSMLEHYVRDLMRALTLMKTDAANQAIDAAKSGIIEACIGCEAVDDEITWLTDKRVDLEFSSEILFPLCKNYQARGLSPMLRVISSVEFIIQPEAVVPVADVVRAPLVDGNSLWAKQGSSGDHVPAAAEAQARQLRK